MPVGFQMRCKAAAVVIAAIVPWGEARAAEPSQLGASSLTSPALEPGNGAEARPSVFIAGPERVVLPYSCTIENGAVTLRPSPERAFAIAEGREVRPFETCDPPFSRNCTQLTIHRFDMVCGGQRVAWPKVVAAMGPTKVGIARIERGHLALFRSAAPAQGHAPSCAESKKSKSQSEAFGECLPWRVRHNVETVVLPAGFGPATEIGVRFLDGASPGDVTSSMLALATSNGNGRIVSSEPPSALAGTSALADLQASTQPLEVATVSGPATLAASQTNVQSDFSQQWITVVDRRDTVDVTAAVSQGPSAAFGLWLMAFATGAAFMALLTMRGKLALILEGAAVARSRFERLRAKAAPRLAKLGARLPAVRLPDVSLSNAIVPMADRLLAPRQSAELPHELAVLFGAVRQAEDQCRAAIAKLDGAEPLGGLLAREVESSSKRIATITASAENGDGSLVRTTAQLRAVARDIDRTAGFALALERWLRSDGSLAGISDPRTRSEAIAALGCGAETDDDFLGQFIATIRAASHPDQATSVDDRMVRLRRIERLEVIAAALRS